MNKITVLIVFLIVNIWLVNAEWQLAGMKQNIFSFRDQLKFYMKLFTAEQACKRVNGSLREGIPIKLSM